MRQANERNLRNEILVAIVAVALIGFAVAFGVLVSISDGDAQEPTATLPTDIADVESNVAPEQTDTPENTPEVTIEPIVPSSTPTVTASMTRTPNSTATDTVTPTQIQRQDNNDGSQDRDTATLRVSTTPRATSTLTQTVTLSHTPSMIASETVAASNTPEVASSTPTSTVTSTHTLTATSSLTRTPTITRTHTNTSTVTRTPRPTENAVILPTLTPAEGADIEHENEHDNGDVACVVPETWVLYVVNSGDTLFSIAQSVGETVSRLQEANCRTNSRIVTGEVLAVPRLPVSSMNSSRDESMSPVGCVSPAVQIASPLPGQRVSNQFMIEGSATLGEYFAYYNLSIRADSATIYNVYSRSDDPVTSGVLGQMDAGLFEPGLYWVRLMVVDITGNVPFDATCVIPIVIE